MLFTLSLKNSLDTLMKERKNFTRFKTLCFFVKDCSEKNDWQKRLAATFQMKLLVWEKEEPCNWLKGKKYFCCEKLLIFILENEKLFNLKAKRLKAWVNRLETKVHLSFKPFCILQTSIKIKPHKKTESLEFGEKPLGIILSNLNGSFNYLFKNF